jgi:hypothetical protein
LPIINDYSRYPEAKQRINHAIGGVKGRMPHFFQHSRNGRHNANSRVNKKKTFKPANGSIMNRICERFSHVGKMNMNLAGVAPFNDEMLLSEPIAYVNEEAVQLFCDMDNANLLNQIDGDQATDLSDKFNACNFDAVKEQITDEMIYRYGGLDEVYPSIEHYLFTGENVAKQHHKQMFWRVFGDIAVRNLEHNIVACRECKNCGMQIPLWGRKHVCGVEHKYSVVCQDCGRTVARTNSKQTRCPSCQEQYSLVWRANKNKALAAERKRKRKEKKSA